MTIWQLVPDLWEVTDSLITFSAILQWCEYWTWKLKIGFWLDPKLMNLRCEHELVQVGTSIRLNFNVCISGSAAWNPRASPCFLWGCSEKLPSGFFYQTNCWVISWICIRGFTVANYTFNFVSRFDAYTHTLWHLTFTKKLLAHYVYWNPCPELRLSWIIALTNILRKDIILFH